jgi:hypothetical protein
MIYLPYRDYRRSAKCLSDDHLREQRNAIRTCIRVLTIPGQRMIRTAWIEEWDGHVSQLLQICEATLEERRRRGIDERGVTPWMLDHHDPTPPWIGNRDYHDAVRQTLLKLDPKHYGRMGWGM